MAEGDAETAAQILKFISMNDGNRSDIACGEVDPAGYVHPDKFTFGGAEKKVSLLQGCCAACKFKIAVTATSEHAPKPSPEIWASDR
ncbi:MAG: hypothetical protein IJU91_00055 [Selenomonadaceae bacterium]|nr:hypothetical protein [Selenomonadaceae bacterium]